MAMMMIDGSYGEGGGQILRTSLALSILTGTPIQISRIRAGRAKSGLLRQHLTAVKAAAEISGASIHGAELGSHELVFEPGEVRGGQYRFAIGSAGSVGLVLQTVLCPLLFADAPSELVLEGGTHNPSAPPFDFLAKTFLPVLARMGVDVSIQMEKPGFFPAGGGRYRVAISPTAGWLPLELLHRGAGQDVVVRALVANLPTSIAGRELKIAGERLDLKRPQLRTEEVVGSDGPGNAVIIELPFAQITEVVSSFGARGIRAERVAKDAVREAERYLGGDAPVGEHLADQLLIPMALGQGGVFRTGPLTEHTRTNIDVIQRFVDVDIETIAHASGDVEVRIRT